ncbi:MAG TPA: TylF/MycF family methyltransferase [Candidatus Saccharimonadales bacterium]|nr:TylF/MycF family methyltransferase [Candidatus Saccharimonadales bacterium]
MFFLLAIFSLFHFTVQADNNRDNYLDLMKKCLMNSIYQDSNSWNALNSDLNVYRSEIREKGLDWPNVAHTMIGLHRLNNLQFCVEEVLANNIPGDLIETGVWRGGASIFMRAILKAYKNTEKKVFVADSFEGLPVPNLELYPADASIRYLSHIPQLAVSLEQVQTNFSRYGLLDDQVVFLKGWFCDTLPKAPVEKLALMRLDGDYYGSTMDSLINLYPKLSVGGYVIIDDYQVLPPCAQAVHDFRNKFNITDEIYLISDGVGAFWKRTK